MSTDSMPIDLDRINDATGGDEEFLAELVAIFLEDAELRLEEIGGAVRSGDPGELKKTAHKLKGSSANMGASGLMAISKDIEDMGTSGVVAGADARYEDLVAEFGRVKNALEKLATPGS